jgi:hypothetical protein
LPNAGSPVWGVNGVVLARQVRLRKYPYLIVYVVSDDEIRVVEIAHEKQIRRSAGRPIPVVLGRPAVRPDLPIVGYARELVLHLQVLETGRVDGGSGPRLAARPRSANLIEHRRSGSSQSLTELATDLSNNIGFAGPLEPIGKRGETPARSVF